MHVDTLAEQMFRKRSRPHLEHMHGQTEAYVAVVCMCQVVRTAKN